MFVSVLYRHGGILRRIYGWVYSLLVQGIKKRGRDCMDSAFFLTPCIKNVFDYNSFQNSTMKIQRKIEINAIKLFQQIQPSNS